MIDPNYCYSLFLGNVSSYTLIASNEGGFTDILADSDNFYPVTYLGRLNGVDKTIAVGMYGSDDGGTDKGAIYILFLYENNTVKSFIKINDTDLPTKFMDGDYFGSSLEYLGDYNSDGNVEVVVGAMGSDDGGVNNGAIYILSLNSTGNLVNYSKISAIEGSFDATLNSGNFGTSISSWEVIDDGSRRIIVGAESSRELYILSLYNNGNVESSVEINSSSTNYPTTVMVDGRFGASVASIGDLDDDGNVDVVVGAPGNTDPSSEDTGKVYVLFLNSSFGIKSWYEINDTTFLGDFESLDFFGESVSAFRDLDNDGNIEIIIGAAGDEIPGPGVFDVGIVYVTYLNNNGSVKNFKKINTLSGDFAGELSNNDYFGYSATYLEDNEIIVGMRDFGTSSGKGGIYVFDLD
jgi:hypothetical protein